MYNKVENNAPNTPDVYDTYNTFDTYNMRAGTTKRHYNLQMVYHVEKEEKVDKNQLIDIGVFKPMSRNATKHLE